LLRLKKQTLCQALQMATGKRAVGTLRSALRGVIGKVKRKGLGFAGDNAGKKKKIGRHEDYT